MINFLSNKINELIVKRYLKTVLKMVHMIQMVHTKSEVLIDKVQEILLNNNINISNTRFSCLDGTNAMSDEHTGLQRRMQNLALFSIYVNCRCVIHWLYVSSICLVSFPGLNQSILFC